MRGKWRIVELPGYQADYADLVEPAYILFDGKGGGEFVFGCVTAVLYGAASTNHVEFDWNGSDEMDQIDGDGWADLQADGNLNGQFSFHNGDDIDFFAKPWTTSSTAC